ncbi:MAG: cytidylate kinase [Acidobacteria bacterium 37-71-11]|nr:MAG: cytidylate kinase [Acidobacteria bacterium 37-71-11]
MGVAQRPVLIAIDGPAGAGKSATAREVAVRLGLPYLDTGAMYRAVALLAARAGLGAELDAAGREAVVELARRLDVRFLGDPRNLRVAVEGEDVTGALRAPEVSRMASVVSAIPEVRREMVRRQRELAALAGGVVEGRDIGTVVFPDATLKVFLTAAPEVRAQRRFDELSARGVVARWESVAAEQRERDLRDSTRPDSPLKPADGAVIVDSSRLSLAEVVDAVVALLPPTP